MNFSGRVLLAAMAFVFLFSATSSAQYYDIGSEKSSIKWKTMKSKNFQIIYPEGLGKNAASYLGKVESMYGTYSDSVRYNYGLPKRFPMVLHPFNAESNGITVWGPRQIDFLAQPPVDVISTEPWDLSLASHEGRHAWQIAHFNRGLFKVLSWGFGDQVVGAASAVYPSRWFLEGDAVVAETQMSKGGRGRSGFFLCEVLKCIVPEDGDAGKYFYGKNRTWDRWRFGSVKAYSPDRYSVGYMINAMARKHSGDVDLADKILNYETRHFMSANVVASAFKEYSGLTHRKYVQGDMLNEFLELNENEALEELLEKAEEDYPEASQTMVIDQAKRTGARHGYFTEYGNVAVVGKDSLVAVVSGTGIPGALVLLTRTSGSQWKEKVLRPFSEEAGRICHYNGKIWWSECNTDPRWEQHASNAIFSYDLRSGKMEDYSDEKHSLHLPFVVTYDGRPLLCCVAYGTDHLSSTVKSLMFLDNGASFNGVEMNVAGQITSIASSGEDFWYSSLNPEEGGMEIWKVSSGKANRVHTTRHIVKDLQTLGNDVYFQTDMFGCPVVCRLDPSTGAISLASVSEDVCSFSIADSGKMFVSKDAKDKGSVLSCDQMLSLPTTPDMEFNYPLAEELSRQYEQKYGKIAEPQQNNSDAASFHFMEEPYRKGAHLFRIHSWAPVYAEFGGVAEGEFEEFYEEALPGVTIYSQNTLGTMRATAGYAYQHRNGFLSTSKNLHSGHASLSWSGWYPVIEGAVHFNDRIMYKKDKYSFRSSVDAYVPLSWSGAGWASGVTPAVSWSFRNDQIVLDEETSGPSEASEDDGEEPEHRYTLSQIKRHQVNFSLGAYKMQEMAESQVYPRWGIGGRVAASVSPQGGKYFGSEYSAYVYGYVPGLVFNHGLRLSASYQRQDVEGKMYWLDNHLEGPRGFTEDFYGRNILRATADYAIPIYLGDVSLGPVAYLQQLQVIPFVDYSKVDFLRKTGPAKTDPFHYQWEDRYSFGADVMLRGHFLRIGFPMYIGVRYARTNKPTDIGSVSPAAYDGKGNKNFVTLLFGIEFY